MTLSRTGLLQRRTPLQRTTPMRSGPPPARRKGEPLALPERPTTRHPRPKGPAIEVVQKVIGRDLGCVVCGADLTGQRGFDWSIHHRRGRDGKPDSHTLANLITVCGADNQSGCHGRIHQQRRWARANGLWLSRNAVPTPDPLLVPIRLYGRTDLVWLTNTGISLTAPVGGA